MDLPYIPVFEDLAAEHQIVIRLHSGAGGITVSCNCLRRAATVDEREVIEVRSLWTTDEALNAYREYHWVRGTDLYGTDEQD